MPNGAAGGRAGSSILVILYNVRSDKTLTLER